MSLKLPPEIEELILAKLSSGSYDSADDVVLNALNLLDDRDWRISHEVEDLRAEIQVGLDQVERGEVVDGMEAVRAIREGVRERIVRYRLTEKGRADLAAIARTASSDRDAIVRLIDEIDYRCRALAERPASGQPADDLGDGVRCSRVGKTVIAYVEVDEGIEVVRLFHNQPDLSFILHRLGGRTRVSGKNRTPAG